MSVAAVHWVVAAVVVFDVVVGTAECRCRCSCSLVVVIVVGVVVSICGIVDVFIVVARGVVVPGEVVVVVVGVVASGQVWLVVFVQPSPAR